MKEQETRDAGSQYYCCGRVGKGVQPPSTLHVPPPHTNMLKTKSYLLLVFQLFDLSTQIQRMDRRTDKASYQVLCPQLKTRGAVEIYPRANLAMHSLPQNCVERRGNKNNQVTWLGFQYHRGRGTRSELEMHVFSRVHATLHLAVSVGRLVGRSVRPSIHL